MAVVDRDRMRGAQGADGVWTKPFPNFANGELQGSLVGLLRAAGKC